MICKQAFFIFMILFTMSSTGQNYFCPVIDSYRFENSLPNPCTKYTFYATTNQPFGSNYIINYNFGDGSPSVNYTVNAGSLISTSASHNYISQGVYVATITVGGVAGSTCSPISVTQSVTVACSSCSTTTVLSTGFDRINNIPFVSNNGNFDPYWYVVSKQYVSSGPLYTPTGPITSLNTLAYDIAPAYSYPSLISKTSGDARYISINSTNPSQDPNRNLVTYRTYFNLPNPLPSNTSYSLALSIRGDDAIYKVGLNGINVKPVGYSTDGNSYVGEPLIVSVKSCDSTYFKPGTNSIDIALGDLGIYVTQLSAEILLYECPTACPVQPCPIVRGANYQINSCSPAVSGCQGKCKTIEGCLILDGISGPYSVTMNYGDGTSPSPITNIQTNTVTNTSQACFIHPYSNGTYTVTATINGPGTCVNTYTFVANIICTPPPCADCIGSFAPIPDSTYIISAWVKEANATINTTTYTNAKINISFHTAVTTQPGSTPVGTPVLISPTGLIIDGWQKIEQKFKIPAGAAALKLDLISNGQDANFDDIRVFPFNGSMKSYVYDPKTMRLMAELDERNYATFYEYDEEGKLIRVKKETEKGVMTIKESRNSTPIK